MRAACFNPFSRSAGSSFRRRQYFTIRWRAFASSPRTDDGTVIEDSEDTPVVNQRLDNVRQSQMADSGESSLTPQGDTIHRHFIANAVQVGHAGSFGQFAKPALMPVMR